MPDHLQNIALIGATGNIGFKVLATLLEQGQHTITAITRATSKSTFPEAVTVFRGDLTDSAFLQASLKDQDALVSLVAHEALEYESQFLEVAKQAGVKVFLPSDYGNPLSDERFIQALPAMQRKAKLAARARELEVVMVNVVTSYWIDLMLENKLLEHNIVDKQTTLYTDALPHNVSTTAQVALAIARLLALPCAVIRENFKEDPDLHISSFLVRQPDIFHAVLSATGTKQEEWTVNRAKSEDLIRKGEEGTKKDESDIMAMVDLSLGLSYKYGGPGPVGKHNELLGLPREDYEEVVKQAVELAGARR